MFLAASVSVVVTVGIVVMLVTESYQFFQQVSLVDFLTDNQWTPLFDDAHYGIMVLLSGTLVSSLVALAVAIPLGTIIAIYLSEFAPFSVREIAKPFLELLGGVPTIVYGYFALLYVTPALQYFFPGAAGIQSSVGWTGHGHHDHSLRQLGVRRRDALGANGDARRLLCDGGNPFSDGHSCGDAGRLFRHRGCLYSGYLARGGRNHDSRGGSAGMQPNLTWNPAEPAATITAYIVQVALGDLPHGSIGYQTIFAAGLTLMLLTLFFNVVGHVLKRRFRQAY